jgi:acid phosphatase (class A)
MLGTTLGACQDFNKCVNNTELHFINPRKVDISVLTPPPPPDQPSIFGDEKLMLDYELSDLHRLQDSRTPQEIDRANKDAAELDIFIFATVLGAQFNASNPELTATRALSQDICEEANALVTLQKAEFGRKRPFLVDPTLKPATDISYLKTSPSYPSGHSLIGYLEALTLAQILPDKRNEILARAQDFGRERNLLGVHYLSDVAAGRSVAYSTFELISKTRRFKDEMAAARKEILSLPSN